MSSDDVAIRVSNLSKRFEIYAKPGDRLKQFVLPRVQRLLGLPPKQYFREFWALKEVSFEVKQGETVGIIGRNGSGKSTLLQMICGTLNPTEGSIQTSGRIAALLELGSGFNPEFTGRENVFLNGAVLGLQQHEIQERFAAIASFADIGDFIEQPVKTYSSGMFVRLAFALAIHVDATILVVDEALSVGDIAFQNKCTEALKRMMARGATVLFVTHDLGTLQLLCSKVIWMDRGHVRVSGDPVRVAQDYYVEMTGNAESMFDLPHTMPAQEDTGRAAFTDLHIVGGATAAFMPGDSLKIRFTLRADNPLEPAVFGLSIYRADGDWLVGLSSRDSGLVWPARQVGETHSGVIDLTPLSLAPGEYLVALGAFSEDYSLCYALTGLGLRFSVRSSVPVWGKFLHPCQWAVT